jgi:hypothetical protein
MSKVFSKHFPQDDPTKNLTNGLGSLSGRSRKVRALTFGAKDPFPVFRIVLRPSFNSAISVYRSQRLSVEPRCRIETAFRVADRDLTIVFEQSPGRNVVPLCLAVPVVVNQLVKDRTSLVVVIMIDLNQVDVGGNGDDRGIARQGDDDEQEQFGCHGITLINEQSSKISPCRIAGIANRVNSKEA